MNSKRILITGGSGFIGRNLLEHLTIKHDIIAPTHKELELLDQKEVRAFLARERIDVIVHAAFFGGNRRQQDIRDTVKNNLRMFFNLTANLGKSQRMIFLGSGAEYGKQREISKIKEESFGETVPEDDYGFSKYACSKYIKNSESIVNLRAFGVFGKYEDYETRFISNILCRVLTGVKVEINQNMQLDYVYVKDLCRIVEHFIENKAKHKFYNIGNGEHFSLLEIAEKIRKILKKDFKITIKKEGLNREYSCDSSRLLRELGDFRFTEMDKAITELYEWYKNNKRNIRLENLQKY